MSEVQDRLVRNRNLVWVVGSCGLLSAVLPLSYDEAYWLGIWRMWSGGAILYESALDNKSPLIYLSYGVLDAVPGPFEVARGVAFGLLVLVAGLIAGRQLTNTRQASRLIAIAIIVVGLLAEFRLYTEVVAVPLVVGSVRTARKNRPVASALLALAATLFTPLAAGAIVASLWRSYGSRRWISALSVTVAGVGLVILAILSDPNLRFGLVELNLASREALGTLTGSSRFQERLFVTVVAALPVIALGAVKRLGLRSWAMVLVSALPPLAAGWFPHYWIIPLVVALAIDSDEGSSLRNTRWMVWAALPLLTMTAFLIRDSMATAIAYDRVNERLKTIEESDWYFAQFDLQPHVTAAFPQRAVLRSPSINYLVWETSRSEQHRGELPGLLASAEVLLEPGFGSGIEIPDSVRHLVPVYTDAIENFDCTFDVEHLMVHLRRNLCDAWLASGD